MGNELDNYQDFKKFIKTFFLTDMDLWKIVYYPQISPLDGEDPENPYDIFDSSTATNENDKEIHGVVIFRQKNDEILNASIPIILIDFKSLPKGNYKEYNNIYINFRIICKGSYIQDIQYKDDINNRISVIAELIDNNFNQSMINGLGEVKRISYDSIPINEENEGFSLTYKASSFSYNFINNKNIQKRIRGEYF